MLAICLAFSGFALAGPRHEAAGAAKAPAHTAKAQPKKRYFVAAIGDSLTDTRVGGGKYLQELRRRCPQSRFDAYGVGGQQTLHMRWRVDEVLAQRQRMPAARIAYSHLLVLGGVNDLSAGSVTHPRVTRTQANLTAIYARARQRGLEVVAVTLPPWGRLVGDYDKRGAATHTLNDWIVARKRSGDVDDVVDIHSLLSCEDPDELCPAYRRFPNDRVHWNRAGHSVVAEALYREVFTDCQ
jgi:lysophospholipase L1-like esterase